MLRSSTHTDGLRITGRASPSVHLVSATNHLRERRTILESLTLLSTEYHAWNAGPRSCLGRPLATYEGITITVAILQRFDIILSDDSKTYQPLAAMNMVC